MTDRATELTSLQKRIGAQLILRDGPSPMGHGRAMRRREWRGIWYIAPFLVAFSLFLVTPIGYAVYSSLYTTKLIGGTSFSGFANYSATFASPDFWGGVRRVVIFTIVQVPVTIGLAAFFAAMFDLGIAKFSRTFRTIFFIPFAVPAVAAAVMWAFLLVPGFGPFSKLASALGFSGTNFCSASLILPTIILIVVWEWTGYNMIILYTAMKAVPKDVVEAAVIDGASLWRVILKIKLPMVRPALVMLVFLNVIGALQLFTEPAMLATFEPQAVTLGFTPTLYIYNTAIGNNEYNLGAAGAVVLALVIGFISIGSLLARLRSSRSAR